MSNFGFYLILLLSLPVLKVGAQERLDVRNSKSYFDTGDQNFNTATVSLLPILLIDIESEPINTISFTLDPGDLEAGLPAFGSTTEGKLTNDELWLNYTYRPADNEKASIMVRTNQPLENNISITLEVLDFSKGNEFNGVSIKKAISLSTDNQEIIKNIKGGFTNDGVGHGYQLKYTITNYSGASLPLGFEIIYEMYIK